MIDLSRAYAAGRRLTHTDAWAPGNHEDGYLTGMDNLITLLDGLIAQVGGPATDASTDASKDVSTDASTDAPTDARAVAPPPDVPAAGGGL
eukprot:scaffold3189_cov138-Isochrysis_galbana.AAC.1